MEEVPGIEGENTAAQAVGTHYRPATGGQGCCTREPTPSEDPESYR